MNVRAIVVAVALATVPAMASAQTVRVAQPAGHGAPATVRNTKLPQKKFHPIKLGPHTFYGTITGINGTNVTILTRRRRTINVDATTVLADGTYSAPLFVGKLVTVDGDQAANGVFTAAHISRMTNLNVLPNDH